MTCYPPARNPVVLAAKLPEEIDDLPFDFGGSLASDETVISAVCSAVTFSGVDLNPGALLSGSPIIGAPSVIQRVAGGIVGCSYEIECRITTSKGRVLVAAGLLPVIDFSS